MILRPFKPLYFNMPLSSAVSPPFDTVSGEQEKELLSRPVNIYHLTSQETPECAKQEFERWIREGILSFQNREVLIALLQEFPGNNKNQSRLGVIGIVESSNERDDIVPHERTFQNFVEERKRLMLQIESQVEPIFLVTESQSFERELRQAIRGLKPFSSFEAPAGVMNHAYCIDREDSIEKISSSLANGRGIVADGHHRLKATRDIYSSETKEKDFWRFSFSYVTSYYNESLLISGIHRIVPGKSNDRELMKSLGKYFEIESLNVLSHGGGIQIYDGNYYKLTPKEQLSVSFPEVVDNLILRNCMGMSDLTIEKNVSYAYSIAEATDMVDRNGGIAILVPAWDKGEFMKFLQRGCLLPQKSTFFYPKVPSGLGIYSRKTGGIDLSPRKRLESPDRC